MKKGGVSVTGWTTEVFAKNLRYYLNKSGKTQKEVARIIGVSAPTFHEWCSGKKTPRMDKVERLATYFGILKSDLIEDKSEMEKNNDVMADIIIRMRTDADFLEVVRSLYNLDSDKLIGVKQMLNAFLK